MQNLRQEEESTAYSSRRYDSEAVRKILARAAALEQADKEMLSAAQVEELGRELGLQPDAVRRAMGEEVGINTTNSSTHTGMASFELTVESILNASRPGLYVALATSFFFFVTIKAYSHQIPDLVQVIFYFCMFGLPLMAAFRYGQRVQDRRLGAIVGGISALALYIGLITAVLLNIEHPANPSPVMWLGMLGMIVASMISGALGAVSGKKIKSLPGKTQAAADR